MRNIFFKEKNANLNVFSRFQKEHISIYWIPFSSIQLLIFHVRMMILLSVQNLNENSYLLYFISVRNINNQKSRVVEGQLRVEELAKFISDNQAVKSVWLSEDATAVISKIKYDSVTNQLVGLLLPTNPNNGCPTPFRLVFVI